MAFTDLVLEKSSVQSSQDGSKKRVSGELAERTASQHLRSWFLRRKCRWDGSVGVGV